jgi:hypothetical protein
MARRGGGTRPFHSVVATTFSIEFAALEEVMLPQLMASGATNVLVISDERMASMSLSDGSRLPVQLGREYELTSPPVAGGLFHPKVVVQLGRRSGRLFVGSANVTAAGLAGNAETVIELECGDEDTPEREIIRSAWRYVSSLVPADAGAAREAIDWAAARAPWLADADGEALQTLDDGSLIAFLVRAGSAGIAERFIAMVGGEPVERLVVASPYWDDRLEALAMLTDGLTPSVATVLLDARGHEFPLGGSVPRGLEFRDFPSAASLAGRFKHAKFVIASTATHDHVLVGSANCTVAAMGRQGFGGANQEACVYRRLARGRAIDALGLTEAIAAAPIDPDSMVRRDAPPPIPLEEIAVRRPGSFELEGATLLWLPPHDMHGTGWLRMIDHAGIEAARIPFDLKGPRAEVQPFRLEIDRSDIISFVVVEQDGFTSNRAHVTHRTLLRRCRREVATGAVARATAAFDAGQDFDLWMHGAFEELARADLADRPAPSISRLRSRASDDRGDGQPARELTYEQFMELRSDDRRGGDDPVSSLAGMHSDSVRGFLNMVVGKPPTDAGSVPAEEAWLELGDEDEERELELETSLAESPDVVEPRTEEVVHAEVDAAHFEKMVRLYASNVTAGEDPLGPGDVLRVRFWLMMMLLKARHAGLPRGLEISTNEQGWPRMVLRVISSFFCGKRPPITRLMMAREYTCMPIDFLECWATVLWALDAIEISLDGQPRHRQFVGFVQRARLDVVRILALSPIELAGETMVSMRQALDRTLGGRLGLTTT